MKEENNKDDEEISIDTKKSKISSISENSDEDEEFSIDFSKITNFFKKKKKDEVKEIKEEVKKAEEAVKTEEPEERKKDEKVIQEVKKELKQEEKEAAKIDQEEEKFEKRVEKTKEKLEKAEQKADDEEEISIDFGKIKNLFKSKDKPKTEQPKKSSDDDEISFDFSKVKNIFKGKKEKVSRSDEDEVSIEWDKTFDFFKSNKRVVVPAVLIIIAIFFSVFLRVQSAYLPITEEWAQDSVTNSIKNQISAQIDQKYPNLPSQNKQSLIEAELNKVLREQKSQIDMQIKGTADYFRSRLQNDKGQTYLLAIDPWFWMRHARNIIDHGHPGDEIRDGVYWDTHMFAPNGRPVPPDMFHAYFEAYLYKFMSFFDKDIELIKVAFYIPVLLSALAVIPAFFIARKLGGNFGGFIAATIVAIHPSFLSRTAGGFADTDAYNILLPLMITWLFLAALESRDIKKGLALSGLSGVFVGLFAFSWGGWWFIYDFIIASTIIYLAYYVVVHRNDILNVFKKKEIKNSLMVLLSFVLTSAIFTSMFRGFSSFINESLWGPLGFAKLKEVGIRTVWPNVYTTVAEQNPASLNNVINQIGLGKWIFLLIALMGIVLTLTNIKKKKTWFVAGTVAWYVFIFTILKPQNLNLFLFLISIPIIIRLIMAVIESDTEIDIKYSILLIIWLIATLYASVKGVRFLLLLVPSFAVGFGIAFGQLFKFASKYLTNGFNINKWISKAVIAVILLLVVGIFPVPFPPFCLGNTCDNAYNTAKREIPSMNDAWFASLDKINKEAAPDAIINSWWDFGHWFKYVGDRGVTFDGTSQNTPQAHWIGNSLLTSDEDTSIGILRMLDCSGYGGGTRAYNKVFEIIKDEPESVDIIYEVIKVDKEKAQEILEKNDNFEEKDINEILSYTHCEPPENYYITSDDMIGKSGVWAHFGSWDFDRALIHKTIKSEEYKNDLEKSVVFLQEKYDYDRSEAEKIFYEIQAITTNRQANDWIAPWPGYAGTVGCARVDDETLQCSNLIINLTTFDIYVPTTEGKKYPSQASFQTDEDLIVKRYNESVITLQNGRGLGTALIKNGESYSLLQLDEALTASMFTRLFYMEGIGLKHFKKFSDEKSLTGGRIIIWKVDWEGKEKNVVKPVEEPYTEELVDESEQKINDTIKDNSNETEINESL